ncbi:MAG: hypothetical protein AAGA03_10120, partial [Planctomycetota bacterium]
MLRVINCRAFELYRSPVNFRTRHPRVHPISLAGLTMLVLAITWPSPVFAQPAEQQAKIADRFLQVVLRRPRPGTALDRVYAHHIQAGTLDQLFADLEAKSHEGDLAGQRAMLLGLLQIQRGADADAVKSLSRAETLLGSDAMSSYYLGKALLLVGRADEAAKAYQRSIDRKPARNEALPVFTELGRLYQRGEQNEKALEVWDRLEQTFPGDARVGEQIARTLAEEGELDAALARYQKLARESGDRNDYRSIGFSIAAAELKRQLGQSDVATQDLEALLARLRPGSWLHSDVRRRIEAGFLKSGDYGGLADYYQEQVTKDPDQIDTRLR